MLVKALAALSLLASAVAGSGDSKSHLRQATDNFRNLQDDGSDHPCQLPVEEAFLPLVDVMNYPILRPSYLENCVAALPVNTTEILLHINATIDNFHQYYCFYNIANDPEDSDPSNHQPELGYTIFSGAAEGQVNVDAEVQELVDMISEEGATAASFMDLQLIFYKLYDAHVSLPSLSFPYTSYHQWIIPERNLDNATRGVPAWLPSYNAEGDMDLQIKWQYSDGTDESQRVISMNGMSPYDFFYSLVMNPAMGGILPYQSPGARMNQLFKLPVFDIGWVSLFPSAARPSEGLPESFVVAYEDGEEETFHTGVSMLPLSDTVYAYLNLTEVPAIDIPGAAWQGFEAAVLMVENATNPPELTPPDDMGALERKLNAERKTRAMDDQSFDWDETIPIISFSDFESPIGAYKIEDDYAVLKINDFNFLFHYGDLEALDKFGQEGNYEAAAIPEIWSNFTAAAKAKGVKKAIIDVSGNGGGIATSGTMLALSMFPFTPYEVIAEEYDQNYNDVMDVYNVGVKPVVDVLLEAVNNSTDTELQEYIDTLPATFIDQLLGVTQALIVFCCSGQDLEECAGGEQCKPLSLQYLDIERLQEFTTGPQLRSVMLTILGNFEIYNPFNVLGFQDKIDFDNPVESVRGGVLQNTTNKFAFVDRGLYYYTVARSLQNQWMFDEYAIVSDGAAGSTTCLFTSLATQVWANRDLSGASTPVTTVTYGGTKDPSDTTVTGFPASVQNVKLEYPIITSGLLTMTQFVLPSNLTDTLELINAIYGSFAPLPPYFGESLPRMPVNNFYSYFMEPGALPLQYVKIVGDEHIPQFFTRTSLASSADLASLYKHTARIAFKGESSTPGTEESFDEASPPEDSADGAYGQSP